MYYLILRVLPGRSLVEALMPLSLQMAETDVPLRAAILPSVSPFLMVTLCEERDFDLEEADAELRVRFELYWWA